MKPMTPDEARDLLEKQGRKAGTWAPAGSDREIHPAFASEQVEALTALRSILDQQLAEFEGKKAEAMQKLALLKHGGGA